MSHGKIRSSAHYDQEAYDEYRPLTMTNAGMRPKSSVIGRRSGNHLQVKRRLRNISSLNYTSNGSKPAFQYRQTGPLSSSSASYYGPPPTTSNTTKHLKKGETCLSFAVGDGGFGYPQSLCSSTKNGPQTTGIDDSDHFDDKMGLEGMRRKY